MNKCFTVFAQRKTQTLWLPPATLVVARMSSRKSNKEAKAVERQILAQAETETDTPILNSRTTVSDPHAEVWTPADLLVNTNAVDEDLSSEEGEERESSDDKCFEVSVNDRMYLCFRLSPAFVVTRRRERAWDNIPSHPSRVFLTFDLFLVVSNFLRM